MIPIPNTITYKIKGLIDVSGLPVNYETANNQNIPTINEEPKEIPVPMMQTGWVPQLVDPLAQEAPKTSAENSIKSDIPDSKLPP